jgi:hypothetical protein
MPNIVAQRIRHLIETAHKQCAEAGRPLDLAAVYSNVLVRCGVCREDAIRVASDDSQDPIAAILFFAGDAHNFAILAVEEALAAACAQTRAAA